MWIPVASDTWFLATLSGNTCNDFISLKSWPMILICKTLKLLPLFVNIVDWYIRIDLSNISILKDIKLNLGQRIADEDLTIIEAYKIPTTDVRTWTGNRKNGKTIYESGSRPHWSTQMWWRVWSQLFQVRSLKEHQIWRKKFDAQK